ncbi:succinylglutamate desuccinylase/aspartoacylase domain protein [Halobacteriovorax sp. BALOs_7]|uniref:M14 family murein peptide amidase A n=1 Tax=Halobacteriovorax sp. BALOs_7 TaxID=2109558 RepID=UPI000EA1733F|nr:M14 family murein peptide amidase A [Halobacteriovorax sp. BALOs_7]AYF44326.1 succinylglutamate desuccinylase/aspartoacylase domain protein [Halobacteriovorax sp. BALOs_7]
MKFTKLESGKSVNNQEITAFRNEIDSDRYIYLMAGVHGDEIEGVHCLKELYSWLKEQSEEAIDLPLVVIPIVNVDGIQAGTRVNANGVDLNRNLPTASWDPNFEQDKYNPGKAPLSEPENQYLDKLFKEYPPAFILSIHSWKPIINYNGDCKDVAELLAKHNEYPIADDIGYPTPGSLGTYGSIDLKAPVLTFECPTVDTGITVEEVWQENEKGFKAILEEPILKRFL